jgi:hypothetical protein
MLDSQKNHDAVHIKDKYLQIGKIPTRVIGKSLCFGIYALFCFFFPLDSGIVSVSKLKSLSFNAYVFEI